jgi:hypothetical protein
MKRFFLLIAFSLGLTGCAGVPGDAVNAAAAFASDVFTGPDTDYTNYLKHCRSEVAAQKDAAEADSKALERALTKGNEKTQYGAVLIMAFKAGQGGPKVGCTVARKKGTAELLLGESNILNLGVELYRENRAGARFERQLAADADLAKQRLVHEQRMTDRQNTLLTTLTGDKLELDKQSNSFELDKAKLAP